MITSAQCQERFGNPEAEKGMVLLDVPTALEVGVIPKKIYCNKLLVAPLTIALTNVIDRGLVSQIRTWDGCFNIRQKKGGTSPSLHSWGMAIDINAATNQFAHHPTMSPELVSCFTGAGFEWGGRWGVMDGMHFQLAMLPPLP